jgi:hypothetical protein
VFPQSCYNLELRERDVKCATSDGKTTTIKVPYHEGALRPNKVAFSLKTTTVYDTSGARLTEAEVLKRARPGTPVIIARWGDTIGLDYLFVLNSETLVLVVPADREVPMPEERPVWSFWARALRALENAEEEFILHQVRTIYERELRQAHFTMAPE